jgi:hypothetical protein
LIVIMCVFACICPALQSHAVQDCIAAPPPLAQ